MRKMLVLALAVFLQGCGDGGTGPSGPANITGHYALQSVGGASLPANLLTEGDFRSDITGGSVQLNTDKSYRYVLLLRITQGAAVSTNQIESVGTYQQNGSQVILTAPGTVGQYSASITGNTLTMTAQAGLTFVFRK